jgi:predicted RNase H-like nuclease (RuvC/YqgF family)
MGDIQEMEREVERAEARRKVIDMRWQKGEATDEEFQRAEHEVYVLWRELEDAKKAATPHLCWAEILLIVVIVYLIAWGGGR